MVEVGNQRDHVLKQCRAYVAMIQSIAHCLKSAERDDKPNPVQKRKKLNEIVRLLCFIRSFVTKAIIVTPIYENIDVNSQITEWKNVMDEIHKLCIKFQKHVDSSFPEMEFFVKSRDRMIENENNCIAEHSFLFGEKCDFEPKSVIGTSKNNEQIGTSMLSSGSTCTSFNRKTLLKITSYLRRIEETVVFQRALILEQQSFATDYLQGKDREDKDNETQRLYSIANFSYGTTPFYSWKKVLSCPVLVEAVGESIQASKPSDVYKPQFVIFGSSVGYLAFYSHAVWSGALHVVGYEILPFLHSIADGLRTSHDMDRITFINQDMMNANLDKCMVLALASQCWDEELIRKVYEKVAKDLPLKGFVIDYIDFLSGKQEFDLIDIVVGDVSWNPTQQFYIYQKTKNQ